MVSALELPGQAVVDFAEVLTMVRGSVRYRSSFLGDFTGFGGSPTRRIALAETIYDAQVGYDFKEGSRLSGLSVYLQGQNLSDERFASVNANENPNQIIDYQIYGRRFLAGLTTPQAAEAYRTSGLEPAF